MFICPSGPMCSKSFDGWDTAKFSLADLIFAAELKNSPSDQMHQLGSIGPNVKDQTISQRL